MAKEGKYAGKAPWAKFAKCRDGRVTIGTVGNIDHENVRIGKAGRSRNMGKRPSVKVLR